MRMRDLSNKEISLVGGGYGGTPPLGSPNASTYFERCMSYTNPNASTSAALTLAAFIPGVGMVLTFLGAVNTIGTGAACGLGTLQYVQRR
jgi:hypothetical protein